MKCSKKLKTTLLLLMLSAGLVQAQRTDLDVPYVPTRPAVVKAMLEMADVKSTDMVYDLGCGDGRIVVAAAETFGARGKGFDMDPLRIEEANANAQAAGVQDKVSFTQGDLFDVDLNEASVITLYLLPDVNMKLRPKLLALKPGTRIVSHAFDMGDWEPDETRQVEGATIYFWTVPENDLNKQ